MNQASSRALLFFPVLLITLTSCNTKKELMEPNLPLEGTWELISDIRIENQDTTLTRADKNKRMIKIINQTHFAFLRHDLAQGKDSTTAEFVAGGGPYTLNGNTYIEQLEYCTARDWEKNTFQFTVEIHGDTLVQQGREKVEATGVDRIIIEQYKRVLE